MPFLFVMVLLDDHRVLFRDLQCFSRNVVRRCFDRLNSTFMRFIDVFRHDYVLLSWCFQFIFSHHQMQLSRSYMYNQSHHSYALYMQQQQQRRMMLPSAQHSHSSSAPVIMGHPIHRHCQVNEPARQLPQMQRTRSGSEPIDPSTVARDKSRSGVCYQSTLCL